MTPETEFTTPIRDADSMHKKLNLRLHRVDVGGVTNWIRDVVIFYTSQLVQSVLLVCQCVIM